MGFVAGVARFGDDALRVELSGVTPASARAALLALPGAVEVVATETHAIVYFAGPAPAPEALASVAPTPPAEAAAAAATVAIEVAYDGPDLAEVAARTGLTVDAIAARHAAASYVVSFVGFRPGFAYLRGSPPELHLPRRATPRARVPALSLGVASAFTGIYPTACPGGWWLLGRAVGFAPFEGEAAALTPGARVTLVRVG